MIRDWQETYEWSMQTGNGDIERDGRKVILLEQCIEKCPWYLILHPVMEERQTANPDYQLNEDGVVGNNDNSSPSDDNFEGSGTGDAGASNGGYDDDTPFPG